MPILMTKQDRNAHRQAMNALTHCQQLDKKAAGELQDRIQELSKPKSEKPTD